VAWNGLTAPARTPKDAIAKARIIKSPEFAEQLKRDGSDPVGSTTPNSLPTCVTKSSNGKKSSSVLASNPSEVPHDHQDHPR
jgi:hypothetical protein